MTLNNENLLSQDIEGEHLQQGVSRVILSWKTLEEDEFQNFLQIS